LQVALAEFILHTAESADRRIDGAVGGIAVFPSPGHEESCFGTRIGCINQAVEFLCVGESLGGHLFIRECWFLTLGLQDYKIPVSGRYFASGGGIFKVVFEGESAGCADIGNQGVALAADYEAQQLRQIICGDVAVADEEDAEFAGVEVSCATSN